MGTSATSILNVGLVDVVGQSARLRSARLVGADWGDWLDFTDGTHLKQPFAWFCRCCRVPNLCLQSLLQCTFAESGVSVDRLRRLCMLVWAANGEANRVLRTGINLHFKKSMSSNCSNGMKLDLLRNAGA